MHKARSLFSVAVIILVIAATVHAQATFHLTGQSGLSTSPDSNSSVFLSQDLVNQSAGDYIIQAFGTAVGVPNSSGTWLAGSTANFTVWMQVVTGTAGSLFPEARLFLNSASGTPICSQTGSNALTANMAQYTFSCSPSQNITVSPADRYYLWVGAHLSNSPTSSLRFDLNVGSFTDSNIGVPLSANLPTITQLSVTSGSPGTSVTISGSNFGATAGSVTFNGAAATLAGPGWSDGSITVSVPAAATSGDLIVTTAGGAPSNAVSFTVPQPNIASLSPSSGVIGTSVQIVGSGFGAIAGTVTFSGVPANTSGWTDTSITAMVPNGLPIGGSSVVVNNQSNAFLFTVTPPPPTLTSIRILPSNPNLSSGIQQQFVATGVYSDGSGKDLTGTVTWGSSTASVATISSSGLTTTTGQGTSTISASLGSVSNSTSLTVVAPPSSLLLTPTTSALLIGGNRTLALVDQNGNRVTSATTWTVDNTAVLTLSTDNPPVITATNPGTAKVKATLGSLSAQATINVVVPGPNGGFPAGTALWNVAPMSGFLADKMLQAVPTGNNTPDLLSIEGGPYDPNTQHNPVILRGFTADGQQMWQSAPLQDVFNVLPGGTGDAIVLENIGSNSPTGISEIMAGQQAWSYAPANSFEVSPNPAVRSDGVVFTVEGDSTAFVGGSSRLIGLDEATGSVVFQYQLPASTQTSSGSTFSAAGVAGPLMIAPDGSVYVEFRNSDSVYTGQVPDTHFNITYSLNLVRIDPNGNASLQLLHSGAVQGGSKTSNTGDYAYPMEAIPDGQGGVLAAWDLQTYNNTCCYAGSAQLSHVVSGGGAVQYVIPFDRESWCTSSIQCVDGLGPADSLVLGDNNIAYADNGFQLIAFDVNTGAKQWSWQPLQNSHFVELVAATSGGGVAAKDTDGTAPDEQIVRFDASGNGVYDVLPNGLTGLDYTWTADWPATTAASFTSVANDPIEVAQNTSAVPGGNPSHTRTSMASLNKLVRDTVAQTAQGYTGSTQWADNAPPAGNKCNLYVHDVLQQAAASPPFQTSFKQRLKYYLGRVNSAEYPALAGDWASPEKTLKCWNVQPGGADASQPGDVVAEAINYSDATGHVGIIVGSQQTSSADSTAWCDKLAAGTITISDYGFRPDNYTSPDGCKYPPGSNQDARQHGRKRYAVVKRFVCY